jgi:hypothetical protein
MCGASVSTTSQATAAVLTTSATPLSTNTSAFIREYRKRAALVENRAAAKLLIAEADQSPGVKTAKANTVCNALSSGLSEKQVKATNDKVIPTEAQDTLRHAAGLADIQILITLANAGFCPGASGQRVAADNSTGSRSSGGTCNTPDDRYSLKNGGSRRCGQNAASERPGGR